MSLSNSTVHEYQLRTTSASSTGRPSLRPKASMVACISNGNSSPIFRALRGRPSPERRPRHALAFRPGRSLIAAPSGSPSTPYWVYHPPDFPQRSAVVCVVRRHCVRSCSSILSFSEGYAAVRFSCFWPALPDPSSALSPVKKAAYFPFCSRSLQVVRLSVVPPVRTVAGAFQRRSEHRPPRRPAQLPPARSFRPAEQAPLM